MANTLSKFTKDDLKNARKAGFKRKKPSKPKGKKTLSKIENYIDRYNQWVKDLKSAASDGRRLEKLRKAIK